MAPDGFKVYLDQSATSGISSAAKILATPSVPVSIACCIQICTCQVLRFTNVANSFRTASTLDFAVQAQSLVCKWVTNVSRHWHTELGFDTPSWYVAEFGFSIRLSERSDVASKQVAALQNLMPEWREHVNAEGKKFYHNSRTRESLWLLPDDVKQQVRRTKCCMSVHNKSCSSGISILLLSPSS